MPAKHEYKVIFMTRPIDEVIASQQDMTKRLGTKGAELDPEQLMRGLRSHRDETRKWLKTTPYMKMIEIDYPTLVQDPLSQIARLVEFLGADRLPALEEMTKVVDPSLHRKKSV
jgi:LPS sulfotransferase NodH